MSGVQALRDAYDVAVIGAGPAGLSAATVCARAGLSTVLFDEQGALSNEATREFLTKFMQSFAQWVERHV